MRQRPRAHRGAALLRIVLGVATGAGLFVAVGTAASASTGAHHKKHHAHHAKTGTINIGFDAELSGAVASFGASFFHGAEVAVKQVNHSGGVVVNGKHYQFKLDSCNDNSDQTQVAACVDKLVLTNHDKFIFGGLADFGPIVRGITEAHKVLYFSTGSAVAALMPKSHDVVNTVASLYARSLMSVRGFKKLYPKVKTVALLGEQDATDIAAFAADKQAFKKAGLHLVDTEIAPVDATDYSSFLTKIKAKHPGVLWNELAASASSEPEMLQQNAQLRVAKTVFNNSGTCPSSYPHTPGVTYMAQTNTGAIAVGPLEPKSMKQFQHSYYSFGNLPKPDPNVNSGLFIYDFFGMLRNAIEKAHTFTNAPKVLKALNAETYHGINGTITMHRNQSSYGQVICVAPNGNGNVSEFEVFPNGHSTKSSKA